jgi:hypothetical protein
MMPIAGMPLMPGGNAHAALISDALDIASADIGCHACLDAMPALVRVHSIHAHASAHCLDGASALDGALDASILIHACP